MASLCSPLFSLCWLVIRTSLRLNNCSLKRGLGDNLFRHLAGVVVSNLPSVIVFILCVNEGIPGLDNVSRSTEHELIDTVVHAPVGPRRGVTLKDGALGLLLEEINEVGLDGIVIRARHITDSGEKAGALGVASSNSIRIKSGKGIIPKGEEGLDIFVLENNRAGVSRGSNWLELSLRHHGGVVVSDFPLAIFKGVDKGIAGLDLVTSGTHSEFIDPSILAPVGTDHNIGLQNSSLRLLEEEGIKVVLDRVIVGTRNIAHSGEEYTGLSIALGNGIRVKCVQGRVPQLEETANLIFSNCLGNVNAFGHNRAVVMSNLPLVVLEDIDVGVTSLDLVTSCTHGKLINTSVLRPAISNADVTLKDSALRLLQQESIEVILNGGIISSRSIADSWEEDSLLGVALGNNARVTSRERIIPKREKGPDLGLSNSLDDGAACGGFLDVDLAIRLFALATAAS
mmetsp:Transcript_38513/g.115550  ORF Transcript_38513/g.115550 Transcript_38513/m.115550 type:complete len:455 (-) Transcript_38513:360-1724(-)